MGFDNDCILNIQSLAGEYFCPVCRLLVYPSEALQSQCTHLYCKACLTYVVGTTKACPYDGYLVTEADSKPLIESDKALAETIGKISVHCLYHRSGCPWKGCLSESTSHCSACAFGNSPVVCNRCGIQIVHRQVQEHGLSCPGVQAQAQQTEFAQDATATGTAGATDQKQAATQAVATASQAQTLQTTTASGQETNQQTNTTAQTQAALQAAVPTAEQWYQQYYQQYPGYDPYQQQYQQYYPFQQQAILQYQQQPQQYMQSQIPQLQPQPQVHPQAQVQAHQQVQIPTVAQPQNPAQVNPQQQTQPAVQPQSQIQFQTQPPNVLTPQAQPHPQPHPMQPHPQQVQMPQYHPPHLQIQQLQPQSQALAHGQFHPQLQYVSQAQPQTNVQHQPQPLPQSFVSQPNQPVNPNLQPLVQHASAQALTVHHSYPQPHPQSADQHPALMNPQGGPQPQPQHPVQMQSQFSQQPPSMRPLQSHGTFQNLQQPGLLPAPGQAPNVAAPQQPVHSQAQQPGIPVQQRPIMQPVQQSMHQQYMQHQQPISGNLLGTIQNQAHQHGPYIQPVHVQSQLRPQGPLQSLQQSSHTHSQTLQNIALAHGTKPHQAQSLTGRPVVPYHGMPYPQSTLGMQVRPAQYGASQQSVATSRPMPGSQSNNFGEKHAEAKPSSQRTANKDSNDLDMASGLRAGEEIKAVKAESNLNPADNENKPIGEANDLLDPVVGENEEPLVKQVKEEPAEGTFDHKDASNVDHKQGQLSVSEDKGTKDGSSLKTPYKYREEQSMKLHKEKIMTRDSGGFPPPDQGKQQPSSLQQRPVGPQSFQTPAGPPPHSLLTGHPSTQLRPLGPGHISHPGQVLHQPTEHLEHPMYKQPHGSDILIGGIPGPGSTSVYGRGPSHYGPNAVRMNGPPGLDSASTFGLRDDRFRPLPDEHLTSFPPDSARRIIDRELEDLKRFPWPSHLDTEPPSKFGSHLSLSRPLDRGPHGFGVDVNARSFDKGPQLLPPGGPASSKFLPPFVRDGTVLPNDVGERPIGFQYNTLGRSDTGRTHPDFSVPGPGHGRRHMDDLAPRSPGRDYPGISSRGFGAVPGSDNIDGRESLRFGDPISSSFNDSRLPVLPGHLHRVESEGLGQDGLPSHLRRGEHFSPHIPPSHLRLGEPIGFGAFPGSGRMGELDGPRSFGHPRLGEPGFRNSFPMRGFPSDDGQYAGDLESFDISRKRKPSSMGWCRICKVDCETVEGLDLHAQTREHQKIAMDMVVAIKQNAKKQKLAPADHSSIDNGSKSRTAGFEGSGNKQ